MNYIDRIGGTSCGGIMGLMLSTGSSLDYFRHSFFRKNKTIFCGNKGKFSKHNAGIGIEVVNKKQFGDARMSNVRHKKILVPVTHSRKIPMSMILFRSYRPQKAPYFFDSYKGYTDGGIAANNPTLAFLADFSLMNKLEKHFGLTEEVKKEAALRKLGCVISCGTGSQPVEATDGIDVNIGKVVAKKNPWKIARKIMTAFKSAKSMMQVLIKECTGSNGQPVHYAREWCHNLNVPYFRFTPQLSADVPLDTTSLDIIMVGHALGDGGLPGEAASDMDRLVRLLQLRKKPAACHTVRSLESVQNTEDVTKTAEGDSTTSTAKEIMP